VRKDQGAQPIRETRPLQSSQEKVPLNSLQTKESVAPAVEVSEKKVIEQSPKQESQEPVQIVSPYQNRLRKKYGFDDYRSNIVDLHVAPLFFYNDSSSNYWYRKHIQSSPGFMVGADVWLSPKIGVNTTYQTTSGASIEAEPNSSSKVSTENDWFSAELKYRRTFGNSVASGGVILAAGYSEYEMSVASRAESRIALKSSGLKLRAEAIIPESKTYQWRLGVSFMPRLDHKEVKTNINVKSGQGNESSRLGLSLGGRFIYSSKHQVFWNLSHEIERNLYSGSSNLNDPRFDLAPVTGVEVTNSFTIFSIGYTWGH